MNSYNQQLHTLYYTYFVNIVCVSSNKTLTSPSIKILMLINKFLLKEEFEIGNYFI